MDDQALFETYKEDVYRYGLHMLRSRTDAEDLCRKVFVQAILSDRNKIEYTKAWLLRIAANECRLLLRRRSSGDRKKKKAFAIHSPLYLLKPKTREALLLHCVADLSTDETAQVLDVPVGTAKSRIDRGLSMLKKAYGNMPESYGKGREHHA